MYSMIQTRPDLAFAVGVTSRYSHNPSHQNLALLKHVFRYYASTSEISLEIGEKDAAISIQWDDDTFTHENTTTPVKLAVTCWVDSDWKGDKATGKPTFGLSIQLGDSTFHWRSKLADRVMPSTTETEYHAIGKGMQVLLWIRNLLQELRIPATFTVKSDNLGAVKLTKNPEFHQRTGHIPLDEHFVRDQISSGRIQIEWVPTQEQKADGFTKPPNGPRHIAMMEGFRLKELSS